MFLLIWPKCLIDSSRLDIKWQRGTVTVYQPQEKVISHLVSAGRRQRQPRRGSFPRQKVAVCCPTCGCQSWGPAGVTGRTARSQQQQNKHALPHKYLPQACLPVRLVFEFRWAANQFSLWTGHIGWRWFVIALKLFSKVVFLLILNDIKNCNYEPVWSCADTAAEFAWFFLIHLLTNKNCNCNCVFRRGLNCSLSAAAAAAMHLLPLHSLQRLTLKFKVAWWNKSVLKRAQCARNN